MRNKRRVMLALYHRGRLSLGDNRIRLGYEGYHWGIIIAPKKAYPGHPVCNTYDATDASAMDPRTGQDLNPNLDWFFRAQHNIDPSATGQLIGRIVVGKLPNDVPDSKIDALLATVPLPVKDASPSESCVTWALGALSTLQASGFAWTFDVKEFQDWALAYGDQCMKSMSPDNVCEYQRDGKPPSKPWGSLGRHSRAAAACLPSDGSCDLVRGRHLVGESVTMSNKRRLVVTLHHRDEFSLGHHRQSLAHEAYHWGIMVMPKKSKGADCNAYDASDASDIDPNTRELRNTNLEWFYQQKKGVNPERSGRLLGRIVIGKMPNNISDSAIESILQSIPLPVKNANPPESCVTWTLNAIVALQQAGFAWRFDVAQFRDWALAYADRCLAAPRVGEAIEYEHARR